MKYLIPIISFLILASSKGQTTKVISTEIGYIPEQRAEVSDEAYRKWTMALRNTYESINADGGKIVYADHLNIATAFIELKEPKQRVLDQFYLAQQNDLESTAGIFPLIYTSPESVANYLSESEYDSLLEMFAEVMANKKETNVDPTEYAIQNNFDIELVKLMADLKEKDQEFRNDMDKQEPIDQRNIHITDSLFEIHRKYIGVSLVGEEYQHAMWGVVQHADIEHQEKYLPVVHEGVTNGELPETPLKMLIDRVYLKKYGYQIFGSQAGVALADDVTISKVKKEYGL